MRKTTKEKLTNKQAAKGKEEEQEVRWRKIQNEEKEENKIETDEETGRLTNGNDKNTERHIDRKLTSERQKYRILCSTALPSMKRVTVYTSSSRRCCCCCSNSSLLMTLLMVLLWWLLSSLLLTWRCERCQFLQHLLY